MEQLEAYRKNPDGTPGPDGFPWPFLAAVLSFSFVLLVDKIFFSHDHGSDGADVADTIRKSMVGPGPGDNFLNPQDPDALEQTWKSVVGKKSQ